MQHITQYSSGDTRCCKSTDMVHRWEAGAHTHITKAENLLYSCGWNTRLKQKRGHSLVFILCFKYSHTHTLWAPHQPQSEHSTQIICACSHTPTHSLFSCKWCTKNSALCADDARVHSPEPEHCSSRQLWNQDEIAAHPALFLEFFASRKHTHAQSAIQCTALDRQQWPT